MNRSVVVTFLCGTVIVTGATAYFLGKHSKSETPSKANVSISAAPSLSVKQVRQDMLRYNGAEVHLRALVVDFGDHTVQTSCQPAFMISDLAHARFVLDQKWETAQNNTSSWILADALGDYFTRSWFANQTSVDASLQLTPAVNNIHYHDYVEIDGIYNANTNTVQATQIQVIGHLDTKMLVDAIAKTSLPAAPSPTNTDQRNDGWGGIGYPPTSPSSISTP